MPKPTLRTAAIALMLGLGGCAEGGPSIGEVLGAIGTASGGPVTSYEVDQGLRQALTIGTDRVVTQLGREDGFWGNPQLRIPLPGALGDLQDTLSDVGLSGPLDSLQLRLNRAAEAAVPAGRDLIVEAVRSITLEDAVGILKGGDTAATQFLRSRTEDKLREAFTPYLRTSLSQVGAFSQLDNVTAQYGYGGIGTQLRDSLIEYGVSYGLDGMFDYLAEEERAIRQDPVKRTTELLRRVFGSVD